MKSNKDKNGCINSWQLTADNIVKYVSENYDEKHHYKKDEWTSISDIGTVYDGKPFTLKDYLITEEKYVQAVITGMRLSGCIYMTINNLFGSKEWAINNFFSTKYQFYDQNIPLLNSLNNIRNNQRIYISKMPDIIRLNLRECLSCDLINKSKKFYVRFGYDYYMSFNSQIDKNILKKEVEKIGLHFNP